MADALPNRTSLRNGSSLTSRLPGSSLAGTNGHGSPAEAGKRAPGLERIEQDSPARKNGASAALEEPHSSPEAGADPSAEHDAAPADLDQLLLDNVRLRSTVDELQQLMESATNPQGNNWEEREKEYESLLEEKSEIIRELHLKVKDLQEKVQKIPTRLPHEEELQALCDELERERSQLEGDRRELEAEREQLREDEESLMKQMREMEMSMSRERAELARQRNELQRLHADVQHALELAARDASLRDRLGPLQRRHQDISIRKGTAPQGEARPAPAAAPPAAQPAPKKESGLLRRLFGQGK